jgi:hypothetical protein
MGTFEGTSMLKRNWKNIAIYALMVVVIIGLLFAGFILTSMCSHGADWPICFMQ